MNNQDIISAFDQITAQADACRVERKVREHQMKKNNAFVKRPMRAAAILAIVLALIMVPVAAIGAVYGYYAYRTDNGYSVTASGDIAPVTLDDEKLEELKPYILQFESGAVNINDSGKHFENYEALDTWFGGILLTSSMLDGGSVLYCMDDNAGTPVSVHISGMNAVTGRNRMCAVSITVPLVDSGEDIGWATKYADMLSSQTVRADNGIEAAIVSTETAVTAYFVQGGILYRMSIAGSSEDAAGVLTEIIGTMQ